MNLLLCENQKQSLAKLTKTMEKRRADFIRKPAQK